MSSAIEYRRARRRSMAGTFVSALALAFQLGQSGPLADDNLLITGPLVAFGAMVAGGVLRLSAALAMGCAAVAGIATLAIFQTGSTHTDEMLLLAIPLSAAAGIVTGHVRDWSGKAAGAVAVVLSLLAAGIGLTDFAVPFAVVHLAIVVSLPTIPIPPEGARKSDGE